jgi:hypothetical protein
MLLHESSLVLSICQRTVSPQTDGIEVEAANVRGGTLLCLNSDYLGKRKEVRFSELITGESRKAPGVGRIT